MIVSLNELDYSYPLTLDTSLFNERGAFMIASYQQVFSALFEKHLAAVGMDMPTIVPRYGVAWVMIAMNLSLDRAVGAGERLTAQTWHTARHGPIYRREFTARDESGTEAMRGAGFFALLDVKSRRLCLDSSVHARFSLPEGKKLLEAESRFSDEGLAFRPVEERRVRPSWLDGLGHVNNRRYGEIAYDAMSEGERAAMDRLRRLDIYFMRELKLGDALVLERAEKDGALLLRGAVLPDGTPSFVVRLRFGD